MSVLDDQFNEAKYKVTNLESRPTDGQLLELYGLSKQAIDGDNNTLRPGMLDFSGKAKWDAWNSLKGTAQDEAKQRYIDFVSNLA